MTDAPSPDEYVHSFTIPCIPPKATAQSGACILKRRDGTQFIGRKSGGKAARAKRDLVALFAEHAPDEPFDGPVYVMVEWVYPWRKSEPKRNRAKGRLACDTRPDIDNICKFVLDVMTRCAFWRDDGQVAGLKVGKWWGDKPGITASIWRIDG